MLKDRKILLVIMLFVALSAAGMYLLSPYGPGVTPDSTAYLKNVRVLLTKHTYTDTHFPPLYPLTVALLTLLTHNAQKSALILGSLFYGLNGGLMLLLVYLGARRSVAAVALAGVFYLASQPLFLLHAIAQSEPLYLTLVLTATLLLALLTKSRSRSLYVLSALLFGLSLTARYAGVGLIVPAALLVLLIYRQAGLKKAVLMAVGWGALSMLPYALLLLYNRLATGKPTDRIFVVHIPTLGSFFADLADWFSGLLLPGVENQPLRIAAALLLAGVLLLVVLRFKGREWALKAPLTPGGLILLTGLGFPLFYIPFLFVSISFFDALTPLNERILSPATVFLTVFLLALAWRFSSRAAMPARLLTILLLGFTLLLRLPGISRMVMLTAQQGIGYTSRAWRESPTLGYLLKTRPKQKIYTNSAELVNFYMMASAQYVPMRFDRVTTLPNENFDQHVINLCANLAADRAVLVFFTGFERDNFLISEAEFRARCPGLPAPKTFADGVVYQAH